MRSAAISLGGWAWAYSIRSHPDLLERLALSIVLPDASPSTYDLLRECFRHPVPKPEDLPKALIRSYDEGVTQEPTVELWVDDHQEHEPGMVTAAFDTRAFRSIPSVVRAASPTAT